MWHDCVYGAGEILSLASQMNHVYVWRYILRKCTVFLILKYCWERVQEILKTLNFFPLPLNVVLNNHTNVQLFILYLANYIEFEVVWHFFLSYDNWHILHKYCSKIILRNLKSYYQVVGSSLSCADVHVHPWAQDISVPQQKRRCGADTVALASKCKRKCTSKGYRTCVRLQSRKPNIRCSKHTISTPHLEVHRFRRVQPVNPTRRARGRVVHAMRSVGYARACDKCCGKGTVAMCRSASVHH